MWGANQFGYNPNMANIQNLWAQNYLSQYYGNSGAGYGSSTPRIDVTNYQNTIQTPAPAPAPSTGAGTGSGYNYNPVYNITVPTPPQTAPKTTPTPVQNQGGGGSVSWDPRTGVWHTGPSAYQGSGGHSNNPKTGIDMGGSTTIWKDPMKNPY